MENVREGEECGLVQQGLHLTAGKEYIFSLTAGVRGDIGRAGLNGFGDTIHSGEEKKLRVKIGDWETKAVEIDLPENLEGCGRRQETENEEDGGTAKPGKPDADMYWIAADGLIGKGRMYGEKSGTSAVRRYRPRIWQGILILEGLSMICLERMRKENTDAGQ